MPGSTQWSEWSPPDPASCNGDLKDGQKLLSLIRSMEKEEEATSDFELEFEEALLLTKNLVSIYARHGLLRGDYQKAEQIMASSGDSNNHQGRSKSKRGPRREDRKSEAKSLGELSSSASSDENLMLSALLRIFGLARGKLQSMLPLVEMAANLCTAISENLKGITHFQSSVVARAEFELLYFAGVPILRGLSRVSSFIISSFSQGPQSDEMTKIRILLGANVSRSEDGSVLQSCLRASATLISLFGTKLSRSTGRMTEIRYVAWSALTLPDTDIQSTAAKLLASLPLAGAATSSGRSNAACILSPAEQWSNSLMDSVFALSSTLKAMVPVSQNMISEEPQWILSETIKTVVDGAASFFGNNLLSDEKDRAAAFRFLIDGFSRLTLALLARDYHGPGSDSYLLDARLCLDDLLSLSEMMLSFPTASESLFYITKKRLRLEKIAGGILSPTAIATEVASYIKLWGHKMMNALLSAVGSTVLLPYANRILRMVSSALSSSSSVPLRKAVDSAVSSQLEGTKRRWLHASVAMRSESVKTFTAAISMFGLEPARNQAGGSSWTSSKRSINFDKCLTLVGGCLLEQLTWEGIETEDWGTMSERVTLAIAATESLGSSILSCGGFMPLAIRALIDSIAKTGLQSIVSPAQNEVAANSAVKVAILELGAACLTAPWPNGTASSILDQVQISSFKCKAEDRNVSAAAAATLRLCDSISTPRVPALHIVTIKQDVSSSSVPASSYTLIHDIENSQRQIARQREEVAVQKEMEKNNKRRKVAEATTKVVESAQTTETKLARPPEQEVQTAVGMREVKAEEALKQGKTAEPRDVEVNATESKANAKEPALKTSIIEEEEDFLPEIVDDDGPDEDDL